MKAKEKELEARLKEAEGQNFRREKLQHDIADLERTLKNLNEELLSKQRVFQHIDEVLHERCLRVL